MKQCVIPADMHKTGTTSIQYSLSKGFDDPSVCYLKLNEANHSHSMAVAFSNQPESHWMSRRAGLESAALAQLRQEYLDTIDVQLCDDFSIYVVSAEDLCMFSEVELRCLRDYFAERVDEVRAVLYLRPLNTFLVSAIQEHMKSRFVRFPQGLGSPEFRQSIERFDNVFGGENVDLRLSDRASLRHDCIVRDFCESADIPQPVEIVAQSNESLRLPALALLCICGYVETMRTGKVPFAREHQLVLRALSRLEGPRPAFSAETLQQVISRARDVLDWTERRAGFSLSAIDRNEPSTGCIRTEADLLRVDESTMDWLQSASGRSIDTSLHGDARLLEIASAFQAFRECLAIH